jgi:hypothetical protein
MVHVRPALALATAHDVLARFSGQAYGGLQHRPVQGRQYSAVAIASANSWQQQMFLVPQRPYCAPGNLADQITYPVQADMEDEDQMARYNRLVCLLGRGAANTCVYCQLFQYSPLVSMLQFDRVARVSTAWIPRGSSRRLGHSR